MSKHTLPKSIGGMLALLKRVGKAKQRRELWRSLYQEAYEYALPQKETFNEHSPGQSKNRHIYDSTAVKGVKTFASRMQASLTPPWQQWFQYIAGSDIPKAEQDGVNQKLEEATKIFFNHLNQSDFSNQLNESNQDLAIGTAALMFEQGDELKGEPLFKFTTIPLSQLYIESIDTWFREHETEARNIMTLWPEAHPGVDLQKIIDHAPDQKVKIISGVVKAEGLFHQVVIYEPKKKLMFTQVFLENPGILYRWSVTPGEEYGRGPVLDVLADIRTANKVKEFILKNGAIQMVGMYTGVSDGIFNPYTVTLSPGTIIPVSSNNARNPSMAALQNSGRFDVGQLIIEDLQKSINEALFANPLGDLDDPVRSATENMLRTQEMLRMAGASFGRLQTELIMKVVKRGTAILAREGRLPDFKIDGREITLQMQSPLAKAEAMEEFNNFQVWLNTMQTLPPEVMALGAKVENFPHWTADKLGLPTAELARTEDEIKDAAQIIIKQAQAQGGQPGEPVAG